MSNPIPVSLSRLFVQEVKSECIKYVGDADFNSPICSAKEWEIKEQLSPAEFIWRLNSHSIPDGYFLMPYCHDFDCCNPDHLTVITGEELNSISEELKSILGDLDHPKDDLDF